MIDTATVGGKLASLLYSMNPLGYYPKQSGVQVMGDVSHAIAAAYDDNTYAVTSYVKDAMLHIGQTITQRLAIKNAVDHVGPTPVSFRLAGLAIYDMHNYFASKGINIFDPAWNTNGAVREYISDFDAVQDINSAEEMNFTGNDNGAVSAYE